MTKNRKAMTFIEMVISLFVISVLSMAAYPIADNSMRRSKEVELRENLRQLRKAIDGYYAHYDKQNPGAEEDEKYPKNLATLVEKRYIRSIPIDPFTGRQDWLTISSTDDLTSFDSGFVSNELNLYDIRSRADGGPQKGGPAYNRW